MCVTGLKILGNNTYSFFLKIKLILCILKGEMPFKMHKIIFFPESLKKIIVFTSKFRYGRVTQKTGIFFLFGLIKCPVEY